MGSEPCRSARARFLNALERRAAAQTGSVRQLLDDRLAALRAGDREVAQAAAAPLESTAHAGLRALVADIDVRTQAGDRSATPVAQALSYFRSTWARLSATQRLTQSRASVPENAGPFNSNYLLHQALQLMQDVSPEYLAHFTAQVDALLWLGQIGTPAVAAAKPESARSAGRSKSRG